MLRDVREDGGRQERAAGLHLQRAPDVQDERGALSLEGARPGRGAVRSPSSMEHADCPFACASGRWLGLGCAGKERSSSGAWLAHMPGHRRILSWVGGAKQPRANTAIPPSPSPPVPAQPTLAPDCLQRLPPSILVRPPRLQPVQMRVRALPHLGLEPPSCPAPSAGVPQPGRLLVSCKVTKPLSMCADVHTLYQSTAPQKPPAAAMQALRASNMRAVAKPASRASSVKVQASAMGKVAQFAGVAVSSLALTLAAHADATVKLGTDNGASPSGVVASPPPCGRGCVVLRARRLRGPTPRHRTPLPPLAARACPRAHARARAHALARRLPELRALHADRQGRRAHQVREQRGLPPQRGVRRGRGAGECAGHPSPPWTRLRACRGGGHGRAATPSPSATHTSRDSQSRPTPLRPHPPPPPTTTPPSLHLLRRRA